LLRTWEILRTGEIFRTGEILRTGEKGIGFVGGAISVMTRCKRFVGGAVLRKENNE